MDLVYESKLELAADAPDDAFPDLLFHPMINYPEDVYFQMDPEDYGQEAIKVDPRFTYRNLGRISNSTARIDRYLEWCSLLEDYTAYLIDRYGSLETVMELDEQGLLKDPLPRNFNMPTLKKGNARRLINMGIVPSYTPNSINEADCFEYFKQIMDQVYAEMTIDPEEPDPYAERKLSKAEQRIMRRNTERFRRDRRLQILVAGTGINGISANMDFIDNYYAAVTRGAYDTTFSNSDVTGNSLCAMMKSLEEQQYMGEAAQWDRERYGQSGGMTKYYDSTDGVIRDQRKMDQYTILGHLQKYAGIDVLGSMASRGISNHSIKAIRSGMSALGIETGLTDKERRKLAKKQRKLERAQDSIEMGDHRLADVLLNNKIMLEGGTVRFEDMSWRNRRALYDED